MEFLVEFEVEVPAGPLTRRWSSTSAPSQQPQPSSRRAGISSGSGDGRSPATEQRRSGLYRADSEAELDGLLAALPLAGWLRVTVTPLQAHPNDPAAGSR
jgi:muconolactone D-isomerase